MAALFAVAALACAGGATARPASALGVASGVASSATPAAVDFGSLQLGAATGPTTVTLTNAGIGSLSLSRFGIASSSANPTDFGVLTGGTCTTAAPLAAGESCTVLVRFKPTAIGPRSGLLSFWDNSAAGRLNVALTGVGTPPSVSAVAPSAVDFGAAQLGTSSDPTTVTLTNAGGDSLSLSRFGIASSSVNPSDFGVVPGGTCSTSVSLASGESCTVLVRFKPTVSSGQRSGLLSFWDNTLAGRINVALSGIALAPADASVSPATVDFGSLQVGGATAPSTVTLTNSGVGTLSYWRFGIASSSATPGDFGVVPGGTCDVSVPLSSGESCTVLVRFKPTAAGARSGLLSFWDNTPAARHDVTLTGNATPGPQTTASPPGLDFGSLPIGVASSAATVTVTNTGGGPLSFWRIGVASSSTNASDFTVVTGGTCSVSVPLASGENCTVLVRFRSTDSGVRSALLSFWDNTIAGRFDVALSGSGDDPCANGCF